MRYRGHPNWPPTWTQRQGRVPKPASGEVGTLKYVYSHAASDSCYLVIEHQQEYYIGVLMFDDVSAVRKVVELLRAQSGQSVQEIGDLEVADPL